MTKMKRDHMVVGIDSSLTSTGICVLFVLGNSKLNMVLTKSKQFATDEERIKYIATETLKKVREAVGLTGLRHVKWGIEDYSFNVKAGRVRQLAEVGGLIKQVLWAATGRLPVKINPKTLKKFIVGTGKAAKNQHLLYAYTKWGIKFPNDDVCDAYAVARLVEAVYMQDQSDLYAYEKECCEAVHKQNPWILQK